MMRIVAWNCNMALERKVEALLALRADIAVISQCAQPDLLRSSDHLPVIVDVASLEQSAPTRP